MTASRRYGRLLLVVLLAVVGVLVTAGCLLALLLELQGFGAPRDTGPRGGYVAVLLVVAVLGVVVPAAVGRQVVSEGRRAAVVIAGVVAAVVVVGLAALLGLTV